MKYRFQIILFALILLFSACSKKSAPPLPYEKGSAEYEFFSNLKEKTLLVDPAKQTELISTDEFSIYSGQVFPFIYPKVKVYEKDLSKLHAATIHEMVYEAANYMAEKQLLVNEALSYNINVPEDTVKSQWQKLCKQMDGEEKFIKYIERQGMSKEYYVNDIKESLLIRYYLDQIVYPRIDPTEEDLVAEYKKDKTATVRHILLKTEGQTPEQVAETRKKIEGLLKRARAGEDFAKLANEYSEDLGSNKNGGLYKNFARGMMVKAFEDAAFKVPVGEISDVVESRFGFHIIKVIERKKEDRPFEKARPYIELNLKSQVRVDTEKNLIKRLKEEHHFTKLYENV